MSVSKRIVLAVVRTRYFFLSLISPAHAARKALQLFSTPNRRPLPAAPMIEESTRLNLESNGWQLSGYRWGNNPNKRILILHGFESAIAKFERYITPLLQKGYEIIAFDAQAHGNSQGVTITLPEYINNIADIHHQYGGFNAYMGHSLGASALVHFLEATPVASASKVVLIAPSTEATSLISRFSHILRLNKKVKNKLNHLIQQRIGKPISYFSVIRAIPDIPSQVLWLHDRNDQITPFADAEKIENCGCAHVRFVPTSGLGHNKIYRDDSVKNQILNFL